jgi:hypothetical protein
MSVSTFCNGLAAVGSLGVALMFAGAFCRNSLVALTGVALSSVFVAGLYWLVAYGS